MKDDNLATVSRAVARLNQGDVDGYMSTLYAPHCRYHGFPESAGHDYDGIRGFFRAMAVAMPDMHVEIEETIADDDRVAARFTFTGTHQHELMGIPGSGRRVEVEGMTTLHFADGFVVERRNRLDDLAFLQQIGALPATTGA